MGTKREHHSAVISRGCTPHSLELYGIMKCLEMPAPNFCRQNSSKLAGGGADAAFCCAARKSSKHSETTCGGKPCRFAWNGKRVSTPCEKIRALRSTGTI